MKTNSSPMKRHSTIKAERYYVGIEALVSEAEQQTRLDQANRWIERQQADGFGLDARMVNLLNAYVDGHLDMQELAYELGRPYLD